MAVKYTNIFHCKTLQNLPKFGFLVLKYTIWQPCLCCLRGRRKRKMDTRNKSDRIGRIFTFRANFHFLGEFSLIGLHLSSGKFFENYLYRRSPTLNNCFIWPLKLCITSDKNWLGYILGYVFSQTHLVTLRALPLKLIAILIACHVKYFGGKSF
jgi:hypothetical protein